MGGGILTYTRVVRDESEGDPAAGRQKHDITTRYIDGLQVGRGGVILADALAEDPEVVAVQVQGVRGAQAGLDDPVDPLVGVGKLVHVLLGGPGVVVVVHLQQRGVVPLVDEGVVAHGPVEAACGGGDGD